MPQLPPIMQDRNKALTVVEYDGPNGLEVYCLPFENAAELIKIIIHRVPSITIYNYDNRENIREAYRDRGNFSPDGQQPESPKDQD